MIDDMERYYLVPAAAPHAALKQPHCRTAAVTLATCRTASVTLAKANAPLHGASCSVLILRT